MVNKEVVIRKLNKLKGYLIELKEYEMITWEEYIAKFQHRRTVERLIQLIVDTAVDINAHTTVDEGHPPPKDAFNSFIDAAKLGMYPEHFAKLVAPSTGARNVIVHEYEQIDDAVVFQSIGDAIQLYNEYINHVVKFLETKT